MIKDLELISDYYHYKEEYVLDGSDGYYLRLFKKLQRSISSDDLKTILNKINNPYVNEFISIMKNSGKEEYLNNLYSNLRITKIIDCSLIQNIIAKNTGTYGGNFYKNGMIILLLGDKVKNDKDRVSLTPYHELLHLLTTKVENENIISIGLSSNTFGEGLNEGYTELLTKRYFGHLSPDDEEMYNLHMWYSKMIEEILGKDILEKCYFEVNQFMFIKELSKYTDTQKVIEIICNLDYLFINEDKIYVIEKEVIDNCNDRIDELKLLYDESLKIRNMVFDDLITIYKNKMQILLEKKEINEIEFSRYVEEYYSKHKKTKESMDNYYEVYNDYFKEYYSKTLKNGKIN